MKEISQFKSRKEWEESVWNIFLENIEKSENRKQMKEFLNNLLTAKEKKFLVKRLIAIALIKEGKTYREIGEILWISPSTISAIKKSINNRSIYQSSRNFNKKINSNKKRMKGVSESTIIDYLINFPFPKMVGKGRWRFLNYQRRNRANF